MEQVDLSKVMSELEFLKKRVIEIECILQEDFVLSEDDLVSLKEADEEFENGQTTSLEDLRKELEI